MRGVKAEVVDQACRVGRHLGERVGRCLCGTSRRCRWIGEGTACEMARQTDISVVEPNDEQASIDELLAEGVVPGDELATQTCDEQNRRVGRLAQCVVGDVDITHRRVQDLSGGKHSGRLRRRTAWCYRIPPRYRRGDSSVCNPVPVSAVYPNLVNFPTRVAVARLCASAARVNSSRPAFPRRSSAACRAHKW